MATEDQAHLMVQCMEAWILADRESVVKYYGQGFIASKLPPPQNVEQKSSAEALQILQQASSNTSKGEYHKTQHGFDLLERIDPQLIRIASPHANRLFEVLLKETNV
jgi:hypothetical protein